MNPYLLTQINFADIYGLQSPFILLMILYAEVSTPRLQHAAAWLGNYLFGQPLQVITDKKKLKEHDLIINYSQQVLPFSFFQLQPHTLLFETGLQEQLTEIKKYVNHPYFFATSGDFSFDILAASFYLMQRYEEYLPHQKDKYGRYAHTNSLAHKNGFLHLPLIDLWMQDFKKALQEKLGNSIAFAERTFQFIPTYDVDIAYDRKGKGWLRNIGGLYRSLYKIQLSQLVKQFSSKAGDKDLFDVYDELDSLHSLYNLQPVYFFLLAQRQTGVDKNIDPEKKVYQQLIQTVSSKYKTGIHLSAASHNNEAVMLAEKELLTQISGKQITANRNHYLLFTLPQTYQLLQKTPLLIKEEFSMGYGTANGFRASTCTPYYWYDLQKEQRTDLEIFPFCFMETTSIFQLQHTPEQALQQTKQLYEIIKQVNGLFITIFHNHLIGRDATGRQWMNIYLEFLRTIHNTKDYQHPF